MTEEQEQVPVVGATGDPATDPVVFARDVLGIEPYEYEVPALHSTAANVVLIGGRRSGKTWTAQVRALHSCMTRAGSRWIVTAPNREKVRLHLTECAEMLRGVPAAAGSVLDEQRDRITFANGAELLGLPPTPGQLRGYGRGVMGLTLDEAGFIASQTWRDASWTLLENRQHGAQAFLVSTPWGPADHPLRQAYERGVGGDPDFEAFRWPSTLNPKVSASWVEAERERIAPSEFAAEVLGEWSDAIGSLFPRELLERQTADVELPEFEHLAGEKARCLLGVDWGVSFDASSAVAIYRLPVAHLNPDAPPVPRFIAVPRVWAAGTALSQVAREVQPMVARSHVCTTEVNGVGAGPSQMLAENSRGRGPKKWNPHHTSAESKTAAYGSVLAALERGALVLPRHPDLLRQLAGLRFEQRERGFSRIEAESAALHDDVCDALALGTGPYRAGGRVVTVLQSLMGPRLSGSDRFIPQTSEEVITTGGGLRLWQRPPLQSTFGTDVAWPDRWGSPRSGDNKERIGRFVIDRRHSRV